MADDYASIVTYKGVPYSDVFTLQDDSGTPIDLTGHTATAHARFGSPDSPGAIALDVSGGKCVVNGPAGTITRNLSAADLAALPAGDYWYELVILDSGGNPALYPAQGYWQHLPTGVSP